MVRSVLLLGVLAGVGWSVYRMLVRGSGRATDGQAERAEASEPEAGPREARAAAMAAMPAVQPPATIPEP